MDKILVSVVIPMYNVEKYIEKTIKSVLNQTHNNMQIIIVDDGSTDRSSEIIKKIKDDRIEYIYQNNQGVSTARNTGICNAKGKYITFIDSDDLWDKTLIEKQLKRIKETGMEVCYCGTQDFYYEEKIYIKEKIKFIEGIIIYDYLKKNTWPQTGTWMIKKSILDKYNLKFESDVNWGEDYEFFSKVATVSKVCAVKEFLFTYVKRKNSLSTFNVNQINEIIILERLLIWIKKNNNLKLNLNTISNIINKYRIPTVVVTTIYRGTSVDTNFFENNKEILGQYYRYFEEYSLINAVMGNFTDGIRNLVFKCSVKYNGIKKIFITIKKIKNYIIRR